MNTDEVDNLVDLLSWCREYQRRGPSPRPALERFCIGFYQIQQGSHWGNAGPVAWQSYCAASLHFMMAAEALDLGLEATLPKTVGEISENFIGWQGLFAYTGKAVQQLMCSNADAHWRRRYRKETLRSALSSSIEACLAMCPVSHRSIGFSDEMGILWKDGVIK
jgi:hypothetical protein